MLNLTLACRKAEDWPAREATALEGIAFCRERGLLDGQGVLISLLGEVYRLTGRWREAEELGSEAITSAQL